MDSILRWFLRYNLRYPPIVYRLINAALIGWSIFWWSILKLKWKIVAKWYHMGPIGGKGLSLSISCIYDNQEELLYCTKRGDNRVTEEEERGTRKYSLIDHLHRSQNALSRLWLKLNWMDGKGILNELVREEMAYSPLVNEFCIDFISNFF